MHYLKSLSLLSLLGLVVDSYALEYYVAVNGNDSNSGTSHSEPFRTVQMAANLVRAGDTVFVKQGRYGGFWVKNRHGSENAWIVFKPYADHEVIIDSYVNNYANTTRAVYISGSSYIEISGFKLTDSNPLYDSSLASDYTQGADREGIKIDNYNNSPSSHIRIIQNEFYHLGFHGILSSYTHHHFEIIDNYIHHVGLSKRGNGMYIGGSDHVIRGNRIHDAYSFGIHAYTNIELSSRILIEENIIYDNGSPDVFKGYPGQGDGRPGGDGILVWDGDNSIVRNNLVYGNYRWGIRIRNRNAHIYNNTSYDNRLQGIYVYDQRSSSIRNNISFKNQGLDGYPGEYFVGTGSVQDHNLFGIDPLFLDPDHGDFRLKQDSPAIDGGVTIPDFNRDIVGTLRPQNGSWDIGAYEFVAADLPTAAITLTDPSPTKAGSVHVTLTASKVLTQTPHRLFFTESDGTVTEINLNGTTPGRSFTGILIVDDSVANGLGKFSLPPNALHDEAGNQGNEITSGAETRIDKISPFPPRSVKARIGGL